MAFTYFFRDQHTLKLTLKHVIPSVAGCSRVRVWDAGCAMGPEPYSLAIMFAENMGRFAFRNLRIDATDVDGSNQFGKVISQGVYPEDDLKRIPQDLFEKYFHLDNNQGYYRVNDSIRSKVVFQKHDLLSLRPIGQGFNLVLCKNVLLHFQPAERVAVIRMFNEALAPGGFLAMEQTQKMPQEVAHLFEQVAANAQLFRKAGVKH
jgi:chemotaxis protein methyltransferase CheR